MSNQSFEEIYQELVAGGRGGWGREKHAQRLTGWRRTIEWLVREGNIIAPFGTALELGCGNGMASYFLAKLGYRVDGLDISPTAIDWVIARFKHESLKGSFRVGDVCDMSYYGDGQFDLVVDGNCLHCILGDSRQRCLKEVYRVTRPGGLFLLSSMCGTPRASSARAAFDPERRCLVKEKVPFRHLADPQSIAMEVRSAEFQVRSVVVNHKPWWDHLTLLAQRPGPVNHSSHGVAIGATHS